MSRLGTIFRFKDFSLLQLRVGVKPRVGRLRFRSVISPYHSRVGR